MHAPRPAAEPLLSARQALLFLFVIALGFLPGLWTVPPIDRDEPRYTQATKQMIETGDYVSIRFQDAPRNKKPVGIHWLQAGTVALSGQGTDAPLWVYRVPSFLGAIVAMLLTAWAARAFVSRETALVVGTLLGATIILGVEARLAKTDAVLLATVVAAQGALARLWLGRGGRGLAALFWVALALGILVKGPVAPMVIGLTVAALAIFTGRAILSRLRPLMGLGIVALVCLPWFVAIWLATDGAFFTAALGNDFLGKAASGQEGHWAPPLAHLASFFAVGWPLAPLAFAAAFAWRRVRGPAITFAACWAIPGWIVFEAIPTKLPHYTLPLLPAIALATVVALSAAQPPRLARAVAAVLLVLPPAAVLVAALVLPSQLAAVVPGIDGGALWGALAPWAFAAAIPVGLAVAGAAAFLRGASGVSARVMAPTLAAAVVAQALVWGALLPQARPVWVSSALVAAAQEATTCARPRLVSVGYKEPSMIFLAGTDTVLASPTHAADVLKADPCAVVATVEGDRDDFLAAAAAAALPVAQAGVVDGFNISKGDPVRLTLYRRG